MKRACALAVVVIALGCCGFFTSLASAQPIGANSCGLPAGLVSNYCSGSWVSIAANSCNVPGSCLNLAGANIGSNSCNGSDACEYAGALIANNSCNGDDACEYAGSS